MAEEASKTADGNETDEDMVKMYEKMFEKRYTEEDEQYMACVNRKPAAPPCVSNWYSQPKRTFDWTRDQDRGGRRGHHRGWNRRQDWGERNANNSGYDERNSGQNRVFYAGRRNEQNSDRRYQPY